MATFTEWDRAQLTSALHSISADTDLLEPFVRMDSARGVIIFGSDCEQTPASYITYRGNLQGGYGSTVCLSLELIPKKEPANSFAALFTRKPTEIEESYSRLALERAVEASTRIAVRHDRTLEVAPTDSLAAVTVLSLASKLDLINDGCRDRWVAANSLNMYSRSRPQRDDRADDMRFI